ncbi:MAG: hypothetical protein WAU88_09510 [Candidatus Zixiibacteriota bacterium]
MKVMWLIVACALGLVAASQADASGRVYGTVNGVYQHRTLDRPASDSIAAENSATDYGQSDLLVNYDGLLFTKNSFRLATNIFARQQNDAGQWTVRAIYYLDIKSDGYAYSASYSPYSTEFSQVLPGNVVRKVRVYYREWRNSLNIAYPKWPNFNATYGVTSNFDRLPVKELDGATRTYFLESNYIVGSAAFRASATQARATDRIKSPASTTTFRTYNGSASVSKDLGSPGYFTAGYSYLDVRTESKATVVTRGLMSSSHTVTGFYSTRQYRGFMGSASYSGRFVSNRQASLAVKTRDENFSGQLSYAPLKYLTFDVTKTYQIATQPDGHKISEYLVLSGTLSRYLHSGVDSRFNWSRTYFQKVSRGDSLATPGHFYMDSYYASFSTVPYPHTRMLFDISVSNNNDPSATGQKYLVTRSLNLVISASRRLEGRMGVTYIYQGRNLEFFRSFSRDMNAGVTYNPGSNINMNVTYINTVVHTDQSLSNGSLNGNIGYSFRQAFSLYLSVNRQLQEYPLDNGSPIPDKTTLHPYSANGQLQIRLTSRSNLTFGYIRTGGSGSRAKTGTFQAVYNGQF